MKKTLFTIALPEEKFCLPESDDIKVAVTKVGKACSAYFLTKALYEYKPDIVIYRNCRNIQHECRRHRCF